MLSETAKRLVEIGRKFEAGEPLDGIIANALLESFATHTRQLLDFLFAEKRGDWNNRDTDLIAEWFFENPARWTESPSRFLVTTRDRVSKLVAHMTRTRAGIEAVEKSWDYAKIRDEIARHLINFADAANEERLSEKTREYLLSLR